MNWFRFAVTVSITVLSVAATHVSADKSWQRSSVELVQAKLNDLGYSAGPVDGAWGKKTSSALTLYCEEYEHDCSGGEETVIDLLITDTDDSYLDVEMDFASAVWFENRIGYGAPKDRVDRYVGMTRREAVALVLAELRDYQDPFELPSWFYEMKPLGRILQMAQRRQCDTNYLKDSLKEAWLSALYQSEVPQFDRLSVFWLDHFSVGYDAYEHPHAFGRHLQFVRGWKDKSFPELLYASLSDPSTIVYLNNDKSDRNTPNENLAREFFELFALGEGNYSEDDIREFARLLTGRAFNLAGEKYQFMNERAIKPNAKIFGKRYTKAETFVQSLKDHPDYGHFIIQKIYNEYVSLDSVSDTQMRLLKHRFLKNEHSILALFESIISSKEFWNTSGQLTLIKSPLDLFAGTSRTLNTSGPDPMGMKYWKRVTLLMADLNQDIFDPDSIDGWPTGKEWVQGNGIDRRVTQLKRNFRYDQSFSPNPVNNSLAVASWNRMRRSENLREIREEFFSSAKRNQIMIEDIIVESDSSFQEDRFYQIRLVFKNVHFNDAIYDHISMNLNYCPHCDGGGRNHVQLYKEMVPDGFLRNVRFDGSDGDTVHIGFSPLITSAAEKGITESERIIIKNLVRATSIFLDVRENYRFGGLLPPKGGKGERWLINFLDKFGSRVNVYHPNSPVRLFRLEPPERGFLHSNNHFECNLEMGIEKKNLATFFEYTRQMNVYRFREKSEFAKMLKKVWVTKPSMHDSDLSKYLLPEFAKLGGPVSLTDTFSLVEYNLR